MTATSIAGTRCACRLMTLGDGLMLHRSPDDPGLDMTRHRALGEKPDGQIVTGAVHSRGAGGRFVPPGC